MRSIILILSFICLISCCYSMEICGPRSCRNGFVCISDYTAARCVPVAQVKNIIEFNITAQGTWADSAQFQGSIKNLTNQKFRKVVFHADHFELLKQSSIWNARRDYEQNEIYIPDYQDGIAPGAIYQFGFILSRTEKPPLVIKSIRYA
ncbi:hypothetical protein DLAC_02210 [Tieghemostelium lacteum]|uniref:Carbohydrate binding domain-containing protein n=1 Tax=Tieghemostelium lacteum TaxID=361077 RepID=A0A152A4D0_TIELA|nr:hypothetical protein DLAC_02210 [Tieghemostelium lacteum]|eukprot:KYR01108.1 hypothetical protein DLAC_02210 [Tieghemostelium lacteum]